MGFKKIEINGTTIDFAEGNAVLIFGKNGSGKTSISREISEITSGGKPLEGEHSTMKIDDKEYQEGDEGKHYFAVFGQSYMIDFRNKYVPIWENEENTLSLNNKSEVVFSDNKSNLEALQGIEDEMERLAKQLARYGGSNKNPEGTLARRLDKWGISGASFNRILKERFVSPQHYLTQVVNSELYKTVQVHLEKYGAFNREKYTKENESFVGEKDVEDVAIFSSFFDVKNKTLSERVNTLLDNKAQIVAALERPISKADIAFLQEMNRKMQDIFFDKERLKFDIDNENAPYQLLSRKKEVNLHKLSTAEQNVVALTWFFGKVYNDLEKENTYETITLVLDDPISSVDFDNKIGIYSFLRAQITKIETLCGDEKKKRKDFKCIAFTHDEEVYYKFVKIFCNGGRPKNSVTLCELTNKENRRELLGLRPTSPNFYSNLLADIYAYISGKKKYLDSYIGNAMRRVLEAYSTFNYATGIADVVDISTCSEDVKELCQRYLHGLLLHSESHSEEGVKDLNLRGGLFSREQRMNIGKVLFIFLYNSNSKHIENHLKKFGINAEKIQKDIDTWFQELS